jgi:hypothetical protein
VLQTYELLFPRSVTVDQAVAAFRMIGGLLPPLWRRAISGSPTIALEVQADQHGIKHYLIVGRGQSAYVLAELAAAVPGVRIDESAAPEVNPRLARELRSVGTGDLRVAATEQTTAGVLAALQVGRDQTVVVQYIVGPIGPPLLHRFEHLIGHHQEQRPTRRPAEPDLTVAIRVAVAAQAGTADAIAARVLGSFHAGGTSELRLVRRLVPSRFIAHAIKHVRPPIGPQTVLRADELAAISPVPIGGPTLPGLTLAGSRVLPPVAVIPRAGVILGDAIAAGPDRPLALPLDELRRGLHVCAPTGSGKSTLLLSIACQLMAAGHAVVLIDSKGDLAADAADHVPPSRVDDAWLFNPAEDRPLGFNLLGHAADADLITEHVVGSFRARYGAAGLGPRSEDILRSALMTLARAGGATLAEVEPLLTNAAFRRRLTAELDEPVLEGFWAWFTSLSEPARAEAVAPLANKLRTYTLSRRVRTVIGQADGLDLHRVLAERGIVLVSLARGVIGDDAASLIGAAMVSRLWHVIQSRAALPPAERPPAVVICDEFQDFAGLPLAFETAIAQSRGYGVGWVLAHQNLAQLDTRLRQAVLANCRSRVVMQTTAADAGVFAREFAPLLEASDLQGLGAYEGYTAISAGAAVAPAASLRTRPAPKSTGSADRVRANSSVDGSTTAEVDAAIRRRVGGPTGYGSGGRQETIVRLHIAIHLAWPKSRPIIKLSLVLRLGLPTTVCLNRRDNR